MSAASIFRSSAIICCALLPLEVFWRIVFCFEDLSMSKWVDSMSNHGHTERRSHKEHTLLARPYALQYRWLSLLVHRLKLMSSLLYSQSIAWLLSSLWGLAARFTGFWDRALPQYLQYCFTLNLPLTFKPAIFAAWQCWSETALWICSECKLSSMHVHVHALLGNNPKDHAKHCCKKLCTWAFDFLSLSLPLLYNHWTECESILQICYWVTLQHPSRKLPKAAKKYPHLCDSLEHSYKEICLQALLFPKCWSSLDGCLISSNVSVSRGVVVPPAEYCNVIDHKGKVNITIDSPETRPCQLES